jgi:hypothetical protein
LIMIIFDPSNLTAIFAANALVSFGAAYVFFLILGFYHLSFRIKALASLFLLITFYFNEAPYICLEPFVNIFGLLSIYFLLKWKTKRHFLHLLIVGIFISLSFLSKQYGILYAPFAGLFVSINSHNFSSFFKGGLLLFTGFIIPISLLIVFYLALRVPAEAFLSSLIDSSYGKRSILFYFSSTARFGIKSCLPFILLPFIYRTLPKPIQKDIICFLLLLFALSFVFYIQNYPHYTLLLLPIAFILTAIMLAFLQKTGTKTLYFSFLGVVIIAVFYNLTTCFLWFQRNKEIWNRSRQIQTAQQILKITDKNKKAFLFSNPEYYFLCGFKPALPEKYGYTFIKAFQPRQIKEIISASDVLIVDKRNNFIIDYPETQTFKEHPLPSSFLSVLTQKRVSTSENRTVEKLRKPAIFTKFSKEKCL